MSFVSVLLLMFHLIYKVFYKKNLLPWLLLVVGGLKYTKTDLNYFYAHITV